MAILTPEDVDRKLAEFYGYAQPKRHISPPRMTIPRAAEYLDVPVSTVEFLIRMGLLRPYRGYKGRRLDPADVDALRPHRDRLLAAAENLTAAMESWQKK